MGANETAAEAAADRPQGYVQIRRSTLLGHPRLESFSAAEREVFFRLLAAAWWRRDAYLGTLRIAGEGPHTQQTLAAAIGVPLRTLKRHMPVLRSGGLVKRISVGGAKYWQVPKLEEWVRLPSGPKCHNRDSESATTGTSEVPPAVPSPSGHKVPEAVPSDVEEEAPGSPGAVDESAGLGDENTEETSAKSQAAAEGTKTCSRLKEEQQQDFDGERPAAAAESEVQTATALLTTYGLNADAIPALIEKTVADYPGKVMRRLEAVIEKATAEARSNPQGLAVRIIERNLPTPDGADEIAEQEAAHSAKIRAEMIARAEAVKLPSAEEHRMGLVALQEAKKNLPGKGDSLPESETKVEEVLANA